MEDSWEPLRRGPPVLLGSRAGLRPVAKGMTGDTRRAGGGCSGDDFWVSFLCDFAFLRGYLPGDIHAQNVKRLDIVKEIAF